MWKTVKFFTHKKGKTKQNNPPPPKKKKKKQKKKKPQHPPYFCAQTEVRSPTLISQGAFSSERVWVWDCLYREDKWIPWIQMAQSEKYFKILQGMNEHRFKIYIRKRSWAWKSTDIGSFEKFQGGLKWPLWKNMFISHIIYYVVKPPFQSRRELLQLGEYRIQAWHSQPTLVVEWNKSIRLHQNIKIFPYNECFSRQPGIMFTLQSLAEYLRIWTE